MSSGLSLITFSGVDDSVSPTLLHSVSSQYEWVEWAVCLDPEKQATPRYASSWWLESLGRANWRQHMRLAGHLNGSYATDLLRGDDTLVHKLHTEVGMDRFQLNAPLDIGVVGGIGAAAKGLLAVMKAMPSAEFILQVNASTEELRVELAQSAPANFSVLYDNSMGRGVAQKNWPAPTDACTRVGYAGGLGPDNLEGALRSISTVAPGRDFWVDMESSLRSKTPGPDVPDVFDMSAAMRCVTLASFFCCRGGRHRSSKTTRYIAETNLPTAHGVFRMRAYRDSATREEPMAMIVGRVEGQSDVIVRVHDQCQTSEVFGSYKCDCKQQLEQALRQLQADPKGGMVIYMPQEGRGIGLANKVAAYCMQEKGLDTVDANRALGLPDDCRVYNSVVDILADLRIPSVRLMTNNPRKVAELERLGIEVTGRVSCIVPPEDCPPQSLAYQKAKWERMGHKLDASFAMSKL